MGAYTPIRIMYIGIYREILTLLQNTHIEKDSLHLRCYQIQAIW